MKGKEGEKTLKKIGEGTKKEKGVKVNKIEGLKGKEDTVNKKTNKLKG